MTSRWCCEMQNGTMGGEKLTPPDPHAMALWAGSAHSKARSQLLSIDFPGLSVIRL